MLLQPNGEAVTLLDDYVSYAPRPDPEFSQKEEQVGGGVMPGTSLSACGAISAACCCMTPASGTTTRHDRMTA